MQTNAKRISLLARVAIFAAAAAALFGGGLALEQSAGTPRISKAPAPAFETIGHTKSPGAPPANNNPKEGRPAHCDDGHGQDGVKNKHCRPISG